MACNNLICDFLKIFSKLLDKASKNQQRRRLTVASLHVSCVSGKKAALEHIATTAADKEDIPGYTTRKQ